MAITLYMQATRGENVAPGARMIVTGNDSDVAAVQRGAFTLLERALVGLDAARVTVDRIEVFLVKHLDNDEGEPVMVEVPVLTYICPEPPKVIASATNGVKV